MIREGRQTILLASSALALAAALVSGCNSSSKDNNNDNTRVDPVRAHDSREFVAQEFTAEQLIGLEMIRTADRDASLYSGLYEGEHGKATYLIEVPENWNRTLVMYAHGYRGERLTLTDSGTGLPVMPPRIRNELLDAGYAWAASSYSANYYDVRAGVEDTNALANSFRQLIAEHGDTVADPTKYYIIGHSLGGHVAGAAIEAETHANANNKREYHAALPMCGVMGDTELFDYFAAYNLAAQRLAGIAETPTADNYEDELLPEIKDALWVEYGNSPVPGLTGATHPAGAQLNQILMNLSGGDRPVYTTASMLTAWHDLLLSYGVPNGDINGVLAGNILDTRHIEYRWETASGEEMSPDEVTFNNEIDLRVPDADANGPRQSGLRWIPKVNGEFNIPVVTIHTLGDLFVPFSMQQIYAERTASNGNADNLVQYAVRTVGHCDFTNEEEWNAFILLAEWEQGGERPEGHDILNPEVVADPDFGCDFTSEDRTGLAACPAS